MADSRRQAIETLAELQHRRVTTRQLWEGPRRGAETALVLGVLRRRGTLDAVLRSYSTRKLHLLRPETISALRAALFELLFLDDAPAHAVVDAAVDSVKRLGRPKDFGFVNGVLRNIHRGTRRVPAEQAMDPRRSLPRGELSVLFHRSVFPDPNTKPVGFLAARGSTPVWIAARRLEELGLQRALRCLDLQAATPPLLLRPAPGRLEEARALLEGAGIEVAAGPHPALLQVPTRVRVSDVLAACGSLIVLQDAVASQVAPFLDPPAGGRVLDYCAAPGGKAVHLAQLVGPAGSVTASDVDEARLDRVRENAERLALSWLTCGRPEGEYDAVLADVPCSNSGVLARRPEARWRVKERHLPGLAQLQLKILREAAGHLRGGGRIVYSTCSIEPEENTGVVQAFLARDPGFVLEEARTVYPDEAAGDGGFMARLLRRAGG